MPEKTHAIRARLCCPALDKTRQSLSEAYFSGAEGPAFAALPA
jgi:hypothetical protein